MKVVLAESAGFCYGVRRAVELAEEKAGRGVPCVMLGPIIHNRDVTGRLAAQGLRAVDRPEEVPEGWHCYDLKGSDANPGRPYEMVDRAGQDSAGSILSHIPLMRGRTHGKLVPNNFWMTAAPVTLADFCAEEGIPCPQPPEGVEYATEDPAEPRQPAICGWTMGMA